jgi:RNA polymerase sigma factor (sigma-70 family)
LDPDEKHLVKGCLRGERVACNKLYEEYSMTMYRMCQRYANSRTEADEMLQTGFIEVFKNIGKWKGDGPLGAWIRRVVLNQSLQLLKKNLKQRQVQNIDTHADIHSSEVDIISRLQADDLIDLTKQLPTGYRTVFNLYVIEGFSHKEIAASLEVSESTSKTQLRKARLYMRDLMQKFIPEEYETRSA